MKNKPLYAIITGILILLTIAVYFYETGGVATHNEIPENRQQHLATNTTKPITADITPSESHTTQLPSVQSEEVIEESTLTMIDSTVIPTEAPDSEKTITTTTLEKHLPMENNQEASSTTTPTQGKAIEPITTLPDEINNLLSQQGTDAQIQETIKLIEQYDSPEGAGIFLAYLIDNQDIPGELQTALVNNLNNTTDRKHVTGLITDSFINLTDPGMREKLLSINQPESLEKISLFALEQGDIETYDKAIEQLKSNPSEHTFEALMAMRQSEYSLYTDQDGVLPPELIASDWAYQQLSGSRLDFIEKKLESGEYSSEEKQFILIILEGSEDQERGNELIKKFWDTSAANS